MTGNIKAATSTPELRVQKKSSQYVCTSFDLNYDIAGESLQLES